MYMYIHVYQFNVRLRKGQPNNNGSYMTHSGFIEASIHICFNASVYAENLLGRNNNFNINTHGGRFYGLLITPSAFTKTCLDFRNCSVLADSVIIHVRKNL